MAVGPSTPVSAIEGVGPSAERLLQARGLYTVFDLLRASVPAIHEVVASVASIEEVQSWRQMATLLQVQAVTPQWAEALVKAQLATFDDLARQDLSELAAVFEKAVTANVIPQAPDSDQMAVMLKDAAALRFAGGITGTLKARDGSPVAGAAISAAGVETASDARGRFRLLRLPLGSSVQLRAARDGFRTLVRNLRPEPARSVLVHHLEMVPDTLGRHASSLDLDELRGDLLPAMRGQDVSSREVAADSLRRGDLLKLTFAYADGEHVKLVSKLLEYSEGRFMVHWIRVKAAELPDSPALNDHYVRTSSGFQKTRMNAAKLADYKRMLRARKSLGPQSRPQTPREQDDATRRFFAALNSTPRLR